MGSKPSIFFFFFFFFYINLSRSIFFHCYIKYVNILSLLRRVSAFFFFYRYYLSSLQRVLSAVKHLSVLHQNVVYTFRCFVINDHILNNLKIKYHIIPSSLKLFI